MPAWISLLLFMFLPGQQDSGQQVRQPEQRQDEVVLRDPFDLRLKLPDGSSYQEHFDRVPYVKDGSVYIFPRENFGVLVKIAGEEIAGLQYEKDPSKADIKLKFTEEDAGGRVMMMLVIESRLKQTLYMNASMQVPNRKGTYKTSVLPVLGGKSGFESWPHPITILELKNLRFSPKAPAA
jgi:hypothetical protein